MRVQVTFRNQFSPSTLGSGHQTHGRFAWQALYPRASLLAPDTAVFQPTVFTLYPQSPSTMLQLCPVVCPKLAFLHHTQLPSATHTEAAEGRCGTRQGKCERQAGKAWPILTFCRHSVFSFFLFLHLAAAILFLSRRLLFLSSSSGATYKTQEAHV